MTATFLTLLGISIFIQTVTLLLVVVSILDNNKRNGVR